MAEYDNPISGILGGNPFSTIFGGNSKSLPASTREKIALAMMMQKRKAPSTFGEGLSAIGDSIGDIGLMRRMEREAAETEARGKALDPAILGGGAPAAVKPAAYAPTDDVPLEQELKPPIAAAQPSVAPAPPPMPPPSVVPPTIPAMPATPLPPDQQTAPPGVVRMPSPERVQDWRNQNPLPVPPPPGRRSAVEPPPGTPVMAFSGDPSENVPPPANSRDAVAMALAAGGPQPNPTPAATPGGSPANAFQQTADAGIKKAPPPQPPPPAPAPAPIVPQATPGYVVDPGPQPKQPALTTPTIDRIHDAWRKADPADREMIADRYKDVIAREQAKVSAEHELWKEQMTQHRLLTVKMHEQRAAQRASEDAAAAAAQAREKGVEEIRKAREPTLQTDAEQKHIWNPETRMMEPVKIAGADPSQKPPFKGTEFQGKTLINYGRARIAVEGLKEPGVEATLSGSPVQSVMSSLPFGVGRGFRSDVYKEADTHAENFVQAFIRQQSGGAYTPEELETEARAMLPKYGDSEMQLQNKREQREAFINGTYQVIGPSGQKGADIDAANRAAARERTATEKSPAASGKYQEGDEAVWPDKTIRVYRGGKWVPK